MFENPTCAVGIITIPAVMRLLSKTVFINDLSIRSLALGR